MTIDQSTDITTLQAKAAKAAEAAEAAQAKLAEAAARREQQRQERATEWDRQYLEDYDGDRLRQDIGEADEAFRTALLASDWGAAMVEARKAMWRAIHLTNHAESTRNALGASVQLPTFNYRDPDIVRKLETFIDDEAKRQADLELADLYDERERHADG